MPTPTPMVMGRIEFFFRREVGTADADADADADDKLDKKRAKKVFKSASASHSVGQRHFIGVSPHCFHLSKFSRTLLMLHLPKCSDSRPKRVTLRAGQILTFTCKMRAILLVAAIPSDSTLGYRKVA